MALLCLASLAGGKLFRASTDNHYVHMAKGWLQGRLHLDGRPPHGNDWGKVTTLELRDGRVVRGFPCKTESCHLTRRQEHVEIWKPTDSATWVRLPRRDIVSRQSTWYVTFPPGPALLMLPFVALWGLAFWDVAFTVVAAALVPAILVRFLDRERGLADGNAPSHLWIAVAWTLASPACFVGANGNVWFTAQILGALFMFLYIEAAWTAERPMRAGLWLAMATACRVSMFFAAPLFLAAWWSRGRDLRALLRFAAPLVVVGVAMAWHNWARFDNPFEFGHRFLDIRWQDRLQEVGLFSHLYLWRNLQCAFLLLPQVQPGFRVSIHGMSLLLSTPWLLALVNARDRFPRRAGLWLSAGLVALPSLLYQNTGQMQFSYRFALDYLPLVVVGLVMGGGARRRYFVPLVLVGAAVGIYGAWMFGHAPGRLFVHSLWPFEE